MSTFNPIFYYNIIKISDPYLANQIIYYPFDTNANEVISGRNGTSSNMSYTSSGINGNCATFNGTSSVITVSQAVMSSILASGTLPISFNIWLKPTVNANYIFACRFSSGASMELSYNSASSISYTLYTISAANGIRITIPVTLSTINWNMLTFTFGGGTSRLGLKAYWNGSEVLTATTSSFGTFTGVAGNQPLSIGRAGHFIGGYFNGQIDSIRIWRDRQLTAAEIADIYTTLY